MRSVGQFPCLFETIDPFGDDEVDPVMMCIRSQIVLLEDFVGDIGKADLDKLRSI